MMMMMKTTRRLVAGLLALLGPAAAAQASPAGTVYGVTYFGDQLISVDPTTGAGTAVGTLSTPSASYGLAGVDGKLYTFDSNADVIRQVDPSTAGTVATYNIGLMPGALLGQGGLAFQSGTVGYLTSALDPTTFAPANSLYRFDISTGQSVNIAPGGTSDTLEALAFAPNGTLYGLGKLDGDLYKVSTATGALTLVGNVGFNVGSPIGSLAFGPDGVLYATLDDALYKLDTMTGLATAVSTDPSATTGFDSISGLTYSPAAVPEPASMATWGLIALAAGGRRLARRRAA